MNKPGAGIIITAVFMILMTARATGQTLMPEILDKGTLSEQMKYINDKTLIYQDYRAIREDIFQKIKKNSIDSLNNAKSRIMGLKVLTGNLNTRIDSLNTGMNTTKEELKEMTRTKNSISVLGMELGKNVYNSFMWLLVGGLAGLLVIGYLTFKRNLSVTRDTKKELKDLKAEFEEYRKKTRLEREKMSMDHFNAIKKLRGG